MATEFDLSPIGKALERKAQRDQLNALCLRYGGPDGSDWPKLLAWIENQLGTADNADNADPIPDFDCGEDPIS